MKRTIAGPHDSPHAPMSFTPPRNATDSHCHVFGPAHRFPFASGSDLHAPGFRARRLRGAAGQAWAQPGGVRAGKLSRQGQLRDGRCAWFGDEGATRAWP